MSDLFSQIYGPASDPINPATRSTLKNLTSQAAQAESARQMASRQGLASLSMPTAPSAGLAAPVAAPAYSQIGPTSIASQLGGAGAGGTGGGGGGVIPGAGASPGGMPGAGGFRPITGIAPGGVTLGGAGAGGVAGAGAAPASGLGRVAALRAGMNAKLGGGGGMLAKYRSGAGLGGVKGLVRGGAPAIGASLANSAFIDPMELQMREDGNLLGANTANTLGLAGQGAAAGFGVGGALGALVGGTGGALYSLYDNINKSTGPTENLAQEQSQQLSTAMGQLGFDEATSTEIMGQYQALMTLAGKDKAAQAAVFQQMAQALPQIAAQKQAEKEQSFNGMQAQMLTSALIEPMATGIVADAQKNADFRIQAAQSLPPEYRDRAIAEANTQVAGAQRTADAYRQQVVNAPLLADITQRNQQQQAISSQMYNTALQAQMNPGAGAGAGAGLYDQLAAAPAQ